MENLTPLINESIELLFIGMGSVFTILTLLIFLITFASKLLSGFADPEPVSRRPAAAKSPGDDQELIAVISAAINSYKKRH